MRLSVCVCVCVCVCVFVCVCEGWARGAMRAFAHVARLFYKSQQTKRARQNEAQRHSTETRKKGEISACPIDALVCRL